MKNRFVLIIVPVIAVMALLAIFLTGGPAEEGAQVASLGANEKAKQRVVKVGLTTSLLLAAGFEQFTGQDVDRSFHADIDFLETVLSYGLNADPRNVFLLVNAYLNTSQQVQGIAYFEQLLKRHGVNMPAQVRATHLSAYAILRATYADNVPLLSRIGWVTDTFAILDEAKDISKGEDVLVRWSAGITYAQVPFFFFKRDAAYAELSWLAEHPETEPVMGLYREVYRHLAMLYEADGDEARAAEFMKKSGYGRNPPKAMFMSWFTPENTGASMAARPTLEEIVPGRVFALYGYGFSDVYFVT